jgi:hypothetical protein
MNASPSQTAFAAGAVTGFALWGMRLKRYFPALAFFGGFGWDAATLGRAITSLDLFLLLGYLVCAAGLLIWLGRRESTTPESQGSAPAVGWKRTLIEDGPDLALQFFFGGLFSALFIFYFLSSSHLPGIFLVLALAGLLTANEFLEGHYQRFTLSWTLFATCAILFLNFALPHLFRSVHFLWFYVSTALGYGLVVLLKKATPRARGSLKPAAAVALGLVGLYLFNGIPPVPLVKKDLIICRELEKKEGHYAARIERPPLWAFWRETDRHVRQRPGEKVFCFTSVFLPPGITASLHHVWQRRDARTGKWVTQSRIGFPISGGRRDGYRGYTYKRNLEPGRWQVRVETEDGRVLGVNRFTVEALTDGSPLELKDLTLR